MAIGYGVRQEFGPYLRRLIREKVRTQQAFSDAVGRHPGYISKVLKGERGPADDLDAWADALSLEGDERAEFLELGYLSVSPKFVQDLVARLRDELKQRA